MNAAPPRPAPVRKSGTGPRPWTPPEDRAKTAAPAREPKSAAAPRTEAAPAVEASRPQAAPASSSAEPQGDLAVFPWDEFRPRLTVPSRQVWTYWELGQDFSGNPLDERRDLFRTIIHHLKWPSGSLTFWPLNFQRGAELIAQPGQFWRGVREARATSVVVFGERAFKTLFPRRNYEHFSFEHQGLTVTVLPGPGPMLDGDMDAKRLTWTTLKSMRF